MVDKVSEAEEWAIKFRACNEILRGVGMQAYELTMAEEEPVKRTIELLTGRQGWIDEDSGGYSS